MTLLRRAACLLAALALSGAAPVRAPASLYPPAAGAWTGPLGAVLRSSSLSAAPARELAALALDTPAGLRACAPLVAQLQTGLGLSPAAFAALPEPERRAAVELAAEAAVEDLRAKVYALGEQARAFSHRESLDREARAELYGLVARLSETRDHYRAFLEDGERAEVETAYAASAGKAWAVRRALLHEDAPRRDDALAARASAPAPVKPSASAEAQREHMRRSKNGWGQEHLRTLYLGYGFEEREGAKHHFYTHPLFPRLHAAVSRQSELPPGYTQKALKLLDELDALSAPSLAQRPAAPADGPPPDLSLEQLAVLLSPPAARAPPIQSQPRAALQPFSPSAPRPPSEPPSPKTTP